ncbi:hypothetical protein F7725_025061 [Dissostichus mawsoni]|uniref:Lens fiber membrane intrinsic protein-like n=1 Tax=Dissostichus mawsoni TaxID=36200 RepID=A0A7J5XB68_DISMA|nr:hypothetical protein F7725_025061 [Dissostichus mawsoni]
MSCLCICCCSSMKLAEPMPIPDRPARSPKPAEEGRMVNCQAILDAVLAEAVAILQDLPCKNQNQLDLRRLGQPSLLRRWNSSGLASASGCSAAGPLSQLKMYSFMGGGLFCAIVGNILLVVSTATDYWMQYRLSGNYAHQGLWRYCISNKCYMQTDTIAYWNATRAFMILSGMSCFAGIIAGIMSFAHFSSFERNHVFVSTFFVLLGMAIYTGVTVNFLGRRFGDWRFSWSYILGWVAMLMNFFAGIFYICAYRMCECRRGNGPR